VNVVLRLKLGDEQSSGGDRVPGARVAHLPAQERLNVLDDHRPGSKLFDGLGDHPHE
jgi:hypothetical protein